MLSIQELGLSIMSDNPNKLYILGGPEYGIKDKYIEMLTKHYGRKEEYPSVNSLVDFLSIKHIIPLPPALYVVRYDSAFVSNISASVAQKLASLKIRGTILCIYSDDKSVEKLDKFLPNCTAIIGTVSDKYVEKYLHSDFPRLDDRCIKIAAQNAVSYGHARVLCKSMMLADPSILAKTSEKDIARMFGCHDPSTESDIQKAIASRNFNSAYKLLSNYEGDLDSIVYTFLQTMIEMEKILTSKYSDSPLKEYSKLWKLEDVYNMFMNAYEELSKLRSNTSSQIQSTLIYLLSLYTFKDIPSVEVMQSGI